MSDQIGEIVHGFDFQDLKPQNNPPITEDDLWLLSFYRVSEISGSLFFGRLARSIKDPEIKIHMTKHFADEAQHAWLWTKCIHSLGFKPLHLKSSYQDQYTVKAGLPGNMMEILCLTQVFEKRVLAEYQKHLELPNLHSQIQKTLSYIAQDEKWHINWISKRLKGMEKDYGKKAIKDKLDFYEEIDRQVYQNTVDEHQERINSIFNRSL